MASLKLRHTGGANTAHLSLTIVQEEAHDHENVRYWTNIYHVTHSKGYITIPVWDYVCVPVSTTKYSFLPFTDAWSSEVLTECSVWPVREGVGLYMREYDGQTTAVTADGKQT